MKCLHLACKVVLKSGTKNRSKVMFTAITTAIVSVNSNKTGPHLYSNKKMGNKGHLKMCKFVFLSEEWNEKSIVNQTFKIFIFLN